MAETTWIRANMAFFADMKEHFVIDPLISKRQQLLLATQLCRMVLKVRICYFLYCIVRSLQARLSLCPFPIPPFLASRLHNRRTPFPASSIPHLSKPRAHPQMSGKRRRCPRVAQLRNLCAHVTRGERWCWLHGTPPGPSKQTGAHCVTQVVCILHVDLAGAHFVPPLT